MIGRPLIRYDAVASTQNVAFRLAELGAQEGTTVLAGFQSGGRGRSGRAWVTAPGEAILMSIVLRPSLPPDRFAAFSLLVADAIAETLEVDYHLHPQVKWPNDVVIDGRKSSGVLTQMRHGVAVVGIGINVLSARDVLPEGATSILAESGETVDRKAVLAHLVPRLERRYHDLLAGQIEPYIKALNGRMWLRGELVTIEDGGRILTGHVTGIREDGALLLEDGERMRAIVSGELTRGPRAVKP